MMPTNLQKEEDQVLFKKESRTAHLLNNEYEE